MTSSEQLKMKKRSDRCKHCARAGCNKVRTPHNTLRRS